MSKMQNTIMKLNAERRIHDIKSQIVNTSWDIPLIKNEKIKALKLQKLDELKRELEQLKRMEGKKNEL